MPRSMTGFGRGECESEGLAVRFEIKSVNHRFLEIAVKSNGRPVPFEEKLRQVIKERFTRGYFEVVATLSGEEGQAAGVKLNETLLAGYLSIAKDLSSRFGVAYPPTFGEIVGIKEMVVSAENGVTPERWWEVAGKALDKALDALHEGRSIEGERTGEVILSRFAEIQARLDSIAVECKNSSLERFDKIKGRLEKAFGQGQTPEDARLYQEAAIVADRCDVSEELDRLDSHLSQVNDLMSSGGPVGRKLEFYVQEINREINTVGSKTSSPAATALVVEVKSELEKIREQAQNLE